MFSSPHFMFKQFYMLYLLFGANLNASAKWISKNEFHSSDNVIAQYTCIIANPK